MEGEVRVRRATSIGKHCSLFFSLFSAACVTHQRSTFRTQRPSLPGRRRPARCGRGGGWRRRWDGGSVSGGSSSRGMGSEQRHSCSQLRTKQRAGRVAGCGFAAAVWGSLTMVVEGTEATPIIAPRVCYRRPARKTEWRTLGALKGRLLPMLCAGTARRALHVAAGTLAASEPIRWITYPKQMLSVTYKYVSTLICHMQDIASAATSPAKAPAATSCRVSSSQ